MYAPYQNGHVHVRRSSKNSSAYGRGAVPPITKKNGQFPVVLLAGGEPPTVRSLKTQLLERMGVLAKYHLDPEAENRWDSPIPKDVDAVIVFSSAISHKLYDKIKTQAKKDGVRLITTTHKWINIYQALYNAGLRARQATPIPVEVQSTAFVQAVPDVAPEPAAEVVPITLRQEPEPTPIAEAPPLPTVDASPAAKSEAPVQLEIVAPPLNISVNPHAAAEIKQVRRGTPRAETSVLIAMLYRLVCEDGITVLLSPTEFTVSPARG